MKQIRLFFVLLAFSCGQSLAAAKPNFVLCPADDQGWGDMAYNGHPVVVKWELYNLATDSVESKDLLTAEPQRAARMKGELEA